MEVSGDSMLFYIGYCLRWYVMFVNCFNYVDRFVKLTKISVVRGFNILALVGLADVIGHLKMQKCYFPRFSQSKVQLQELHSL